MIALVAALVRCAQEQKPLRQESLWYYSTGYSPLWQIRSRTWQGIAVDSTGRVVVAHGQATGPGNKSMSGAQIRIFSAEGEQVAEYSTPHGFITAGIAVDERQGRIYIASDFHHVRVFEGRGRLAPVLDKDKAPLTVARKDGGRCAGVSLGRDGMLFTADLGENRVYRFYPPGGHSSFGSGPGEGDQGFNGVRRVFESPLNGNLWVLDLDGVRVFSPTGQFLKRIGERGTILAMGPDGKILAVAGGTLAVMDGDGAVLRRLPLPADQILDAAMGKDGKVYVIPRGEELCVAAHDPEGKLLWRRGADVERLTVTLKSASAEAGKPLAAAVEFDNAVKGNLLTAAERKAAEARPQNPPVHAFLRPAPAGAWVKLDAGFVVPKGAQGPHKVRFTTASTPDGPGPGVEFTLTIR
jgi:hypothetical protein